MDKAAIVLKGVIRADDAARAVKEGFDGVMVSNHGGRQVDGGVGALMRCLAWYRRRPARSGVLR